MNEFIDKDHVNCWLRLYALLNTLTEYDMI